VDVVILPPLPYLGELVEDFGETGLAFGAQDVSSNEKGAYTGEVCAAMLVEVGARYGLVGHSERRQYHHESSELVARKFAAAQHAGLVPVLCVGETLEQREAGQTEAVIASQLAPVLELVGAAGFRPGRGRLRAGLGHRYRPYRHQGAGTAGARVHPWRSRAYRC
jgi:triosephosphate isomerase